MFKHILIPLLLWLASPSLADEKSAVLAGGCFWCLESDFEKLKGVTKVLSGYSGGKKETAKYKAVSSGQTKHLEVIQIFYDSKKLGYEKILEHFFKNIDPLDHQGQFCDKGPQYKSAIFYSGQDEMSIAQKVMKKHLKVLQKKHPKIQKLATDLIAFSSFFEAEDYHQDYYKKNPIRYRFYRRNCGRDARLKELWQ